MSADAKLAELGIQLPAPPAPAGVYKPALVMGNLCYVSGHGPLLPDGSMLSGKVGSEANQDHGYAAARQTGIAILSTLKDHLGSLDRVVRVVKVLGLVNAAPDFTEHPAVINGCSELFREIWGEDRGVGVRSAIGMGSLPGNISVEIEALFEVA